MNDRLQNIRQSVTEVNTKTNTDIFGKFLDTWNGTKTCSSGS